MTHLNLLATRRRFLQASLLALPMGGLISRALAQAEPPPQGPMVAVAARYAALTSYSDSGTVMNEVGWPGATPLVEKAKFETAFRAPRNFYFRYEEDAAAGGDVYVVWCDGGPFQTWWKTTGMHEVLDKGRGTQAFINGDFTTKGAVNIVAPNFFSQALTYGPTLRLFDATEAGTEEIAGHACTKITATGRQTGTSTEEHRPISIYLDGESGLLRKLLLETHDGSAAGSVSRWTYELEPVANPPLTDDRFVFTPPK